MIRQPLLLRLDARDRAWYRRMALSHAAPPSSTRLWVAVTHLGGATSAVLAVLLPLLLATGTVHQAAALGAWSLFVSHLFVQIVKRNAGRARPASACEGRAVVNVPDCYSFPSGHACAAMAVAFAYGMSMPAYAVPLTVLAVIIGVSRVRLGVHYPGDVLAGQAIAMATVLGFWALG